MADKTASGGPVIPEQTLDDCECGTTRVVPVLHARMIGQPYGGNPYRRYCLECEEFGVAVSKADFKQHRAPHVLPRDQPKDDPDSIIPLEDWDRAADYDRVVERLRRYNANRFQCPDCKEPGIGFPDTCWNCGASFGFESQRNNQRHTHD